MSKFDAFLNDLDSSTVLELNELVKAIEEKFGVSAASVASALVKTVPKMEFVSGKRLKYSSK